MRARRASFSAHLGNRIGLHARGLRRLQRTRQPFLEGNYLALELLPAGDRLLGVELDPL